MARLLGHFFHSDLVKIPELNLRLGDWQSKLGKYSWGQSVLLSEPPFRADLPGSFSHLPFGKTQSGLDSLQEGWPAFGSSLRLKRFDYLIPPDKPTFCRCDPEGTRRKVKCTQVSISPGTHGESSNNLIICRVLVILPSASLLIATLHPRVSKQIRHR